MKDWERERITREAEGRQRHLRDCVRHRVCPDERRTTPEPSVAVETIVPELAGWAKTAVVLHPRFGPEPAPDASKLGGAFVWPAREPWPECKTHAIPYVTALQLRSEDFPEMAFPAETDLFQLL